MTDILSLFLIDWNWIDGLGNINTYRAIWGFDALSIGQRCDSVRSTVLA